MAFDKPLGHFEYQVMPLGLTMPPVLVHPCAEGYAQ